MEWKPGPITGEAVYLKLYPVANSDNPDITNTTTQWIRRIPFLDSEKSNNGAEVEKAIQLTWVDQIK